MAKKMLISANPQLLQKRRSSSFLGIFDDPKYRKQAALLGLGAEIAVAFSAPILIGYWLDNYFNTAPWLLIAGVFVGLLLMFSIFWRLIKQTE
jgi:F0F1-type ATP synthase assembly protein I